MSDVVYTEKWCTCGKISWDSDTGSYNETHVNDKGKTENCNTNGATKNYDADNNEVK